jgi:hypothetical protein
MVIALKYPRASLRFQKRFNQIVVYQGLGYRYQQKGSHHCGQRRGLSSHHPPQDIHLKKENITITMGNRCNNNNIVKTGHQTCVIKTSSSQHVSST